MSCYATPYKRQALPMTTLQRKHQEESETHRCCTVARLPIEFGIVPVKALSYNLLQSGHHNMQAIVNKASMPRHTRSTHREALTHTYAQAPRLPMLLGMDPVRRLSSNCLHEYRRKLNTDGSNMISSLESDTALTINLSPASPWTQGLIQ